ncbi:hypothetical protein ECANGB1_2734 [Enterospora canceri]|uniref:Uncharacterized protein n=1 Tax=Enterospora canceri TaxID=1081671 RepID=A0A1Y1S548_9MICR|nr:hypothetical protein ECANGB1_2734 [Enterospora canceri]
MGPLCFLLLINDAMLDTPSRWKYVDDCGLLQAAPPPTPEGDAIQPGSSPSPASKACPATTPSPDTTGLDKVVKRT